MKQFLIAALLTSVVAPSAYAVKIIPSSTAPAPAPAPAVTAAPVRPVVAATPPAAAQTAPAPAPVKAAPAATPAKSSAFYLGGQVGDSTIGALMGYQLSKMYAMEVSYDYVDPKNTVEASGTTTKLEIYRVGISGLALFPIKFSEMGPMAIYIKVGYGRTTETYTVNEVAVFPFPATTTITTTLKTGVTGGAGAQVDLSNNTTARLGVNYVGGDRSVYLAALYKF